MDTPNTINETELDNIEKSLIPTTGEELKTESYELINKIIAAKDSSTTKDLTSLFNLNQTKKTMVRVNKLGELMDTITDQAITRFTARPDQISNKELLDGLKIVSDMIDKGRNQISTEVNNAPLIQINQQNNEVTVRETTTLDRASRDRVTQTVMSILNEINNPKPIDAQITAEIAAIDNKIEEDMVDED